MLALTRSHMETRLCTGKVQYGLSHMPKKLEGNMMKGGCNNTRSWYNITSSIHSPVG